VIAAPIARLSRLPPFLRFGLVGGAGFAVNAAAFWLALNPAHLGKDVAWFVAFMPAVTFTWWGNRTITFREHASTGFAATLREWARFVVTNGVGALVNYATYAVLVHWAPWPLSNLYAALAIGVLAGMVFNFTLSKKLVFRPRAPS
jgi:putative flippase GtrA